MHHEATKVTRKAVDERRFFVAMVRVVPACVAFPRA